MQKALFCPNLHSLDYLLVPRRSKRECCERVLFPAHEKAGAVAAREYADTRRKLSDFLWFPTVGPLPFFNDPPVDYVVYFFVECHFCGVRSKIFGKRFPRTREPFFFYNANHFLHDFFVG